MIEQSFELELEQYKRMFAKEQNEPVDLRTSIEEGDLVAAWWWMTWCGVFIVERLENGELGCVNADGVGELLDAYHVALLRKAKPI